MSLRRCHPDRRQSRAAALAVVAAVLLPGTACGAQSEGARFACSAGESTSTTDAHPVVAAGTQPVAVIGDSYTSGAGAKPWPGLVWQRLAVQGIDVDARVGGEGGSGYVTPGKKGTTFVQRVSDVVTRDDQLVVFFGSRNDRGVDAGELSVAVHAALQRAAQRAPQAKLLVIGPLWPSAPAPEDVVQVRDVVCDGARRAGATFVDPLEQGWLTGRPDLIQADGIHPNDAGQQVLADAITSLIKRQLTEPGSS